MIKVFKLFIALLLLVAVPVFSRAEDNRPSYVHGTIQIGGATRTLRANFVNRQLTFGTDGGNIRFWLHELKNITGLNSNGECTVTTVQNDIWSAKLKDEELKYYYLDSKRSFKLLGTSIRKLSFSIADKVSWKPRAYARISFNNANTVFADFTDLTIDVKNSMGTWELPLGSVEMMQFRVSQESNTVDMLAQFPSGRTEQFRCVGRKQWFYTKDTFGNKIKVYYEDVKEITNNKNISDDQESEEAVDLRKKGLANLRVSKEHPLVKVYSEDGRIQTAKIPALVWTIKGALGSTLLHSAMLREINTDKETAEQCAVTVYGEYFFGSITPKILSIPIGNDEDENALLNVRNQRKILLNAPILSVPEGWHIFQLLDGNVFYGRFLNENLDFVTANIKNQAIVIPVDSIINIYKQDTDDLLYVLLKNENAMRSLRPSERCVELVLLVNGAKCVVPWNNLKAVTLGRNKISKPTEFFSASARKKKGMFSMLRNMFGAGQAKPEISDSVNDNITATEKVELAPKQTMVISTPRLSEKLEIKTRLGAIDLDYSSIHKIFSAPNAAVSCFVSVYGDSFVGKRFSGAQLTKLSGGQYSENHSDQMPKVVDCSNKMRKVPEGWLAWRLVTGDWFYARFAKKTIDLFVEERSVDVVQVDTKKIIAVTRVEEGLAFNNRDGVITGEPKSGNIQLELLCTGETLKVPYRLLECARNGILVDLPPSVAVVPGITPLQEGVVLMGESSFMMGRMSGRSGMPDEIPRHKVFVSAFYIDSCEITQNQFEEFVDDKGYVTEAERVKSRKTWKNQGFQQEGDEPVVCVSWYDAVQYCNWRSKEAGFEACYEIDDGDRGVVCHRERNGYRLPTEAEWEFAARSGGTNMEFPWEKMRKEGAVLEKTDVESLFKANFIQADTERHDNWLWTNPVKAFAPNEAGLYGMGGNVWEWCQDLYFERAYYALHRRTSRDPCVESQNISGLTKRVMRGGSFDNELDMLRCVSRGSGAPHASANRVGFRCVRGSF